MMAATSWMLTVVLAAVVGPHAAFDSSWIWWLGDPSIAPAGMGEANDGPSSAGNDSTSEGKADTPEDFLKEGYAHVWGYSVLHFDLKSWFGKSWFSTPALPGQLSTTGGWGLLSPGPAGCANLR